MATLNELITKVSKQRDVLALNLSGAGVEATNSETLNTLVPKVLLVKKDLTPMIIVTVDTGAVVTAKNESAGKTLTETSVDNTAQFLIDDFGTWEISATKDGQNSNTISVIVERDEKDVTLSFFSATVTVNVEDGSEVTLTGTGYSQTLTSFDGKAVFTVPSAGTYTATAVLNGIPSNSQQVNVLEDGQNYEISLNYIILTVSCPAGSTVVVSKDGYSYNQTATLGVASFRLPETGTWNVQASLSGQSATGTVNCSSYTNFSITLSYTVHYGVRITKSNSNSESSVVYTEEASGRSSGWNNWKDMPIFKDIKPCILKDGVVQYYLNRDNFTQREDGGSATLNSTSVGDVMIEIPKIGYKMTNNGTYNYISITNNPNEEGYCYLAHSLNSENDCDKIYIGAYLAYNSSSRLYSISGQAPTASVNLTDFRTYAQSRGTGYQLLSFYPLTLLQCLYTIIYKNLNSQAALGQGYTGASAKANTGATNSNTFCYGSTSSTTHVKFLGIEDFYGNLYQWIDGIYSDSSCNICTDYNNFTSSTSGYRYKQNAGIVGDFGYMSDIQGTNNGGFCPTAVSGSSSTYYADNAYVYSSFFAGFGGGWSIGADAGAFQLYVADSASSSSSSRGARLMFKHKQ